MVAGILAAVGLLAALTQQALHLKRMIPRLPRPDGATSGIIARRSLAGTASPSTGRHTVAYYRLLVIGDSMVRGVGCKQTYETLGYQLALQFAQRLAELGQSCCVEWHLLGRTGYTVSQVRKRLVPLIPAVFEQTSSAPIMIEVGSELSAALRSAGLAVADCDVLTPRSMCVASCSANDLVYLRSAQQLRSELLQLLAAIRDRLGDDTPYFHVGMPPIDMFPLPWPLRSLLNRGLRAYDDVHRDMSRTVPGFYHLAVIQRLHSDFELSKADDTALVEAVAGFYQQQQQQQQRTAGLRPPSSSSEHPLPAVYDHSIPARVRPLVRDLVAADRFHLNYHGTSMLAALSVPHMVRWSAQPGQPTPLSNKRADSPPLAPRPKCTGIAHATMSKL